MTTKYCSHWIDLEPAGVGIYDVFIDDEISYGTIEGEENALACGRAYIDEMIDAARQDGGFVEPDEPDRDEALEWGGVNYP